VEGSKVKNTKAEYWAPRINAEWRKSVEGILGVGRELIRAKEKCEHGEFLRLFKGHDNAVREPVPFGINAAQRLMKVAGHPVLANADQSQHLPQSYQTLYELSQLDDDDTIEGMKRGDVPMEMSAVTAGIKAGEITPDMTRADAAALRADPVEKPEQPPHEEMAEAVKNAVTKFVGQLTTRQQFEYVRQRLQSLLNFLSAQEAEYGSRRPREKAAAKRAG
jgi:hypothetical protein